jgi:hypothetical protein
LDEGSILRAVLVTVSLAGFVMESSVSAEASTGLGRAVGLH